MLPNQHVTLEQIQHQLEIRQEILHNPKFVGFTSLAWLLAAVLTSMPRSARAAAHKLDPGIQISKRASV